MSALRALRRVTVFCGSSGGTRPAYLAAARRLGAVLGARGLGLVYGGADVGLMGAVADAALEAGSDVVGVIPESLVRREVAHEGLGDLRVVGSMHERKATMTELGDAFVALPGGLGTLEELFEVLTWAQLGIHSKPVGLLDVDDYFAPLRAMLDHATEEGFVRPEHRAMVASASEADALLDRLGAIPMPRAEKWLDRDQT
ncbi:MAG: TIGR00730 family Rossman fold protein [Myxococcota bacterium]